MPAESSEAFEAFVAACSAAAGAIVSKFVSYPLDLMKTKLATQEDGKQRGAVAVFQVQSWPGLSFARLISHAIAIIRSSCGRRVSQACTWGWARKW